MATIRCSGCGKSYSDNPKLYDGEVHCPHCGLSVDGTRYIAHYAMPDKPGMGGLIATIIIIAIVIALFVLGLRIIGSIIGIIAVFLVWAWFFRPLSDYIFAHLDYEAYQEEVQQRQKRNAEHMAEMQKMQKEADAKKYNYYKYKCPMCGSNKIANLSTLSKAASIELFGAASKKLGKCYYCDDCKYMW